MMKSIVTILLLAGCTFSTSADAVPPELKKLQKIRSEKIKEIDDAYVKALENLKNKYMKLGDLESANAVNNELNKLKGNAIVVEQKSSTQSSQAEIQSDIKPLPDGTKTYKVTEGKIACICTRCSFIDAQKMAQSYGGKIYYPSDYKDTRQVIRLLKAKPPAKVWLDITCFKKNDKLIFTTPDGNPYDYEEVIKLPSLDSNITPGIEHRLMIHNRKMEGLPRQKKYDAGGGFILLLSDSET